ncbi:hypothetical protein PV327_001125 [Microctonus hyperodae]|uniref:G-protein coupled receptors family 1 profile domain-containing protein n=1 Tax=Microctonus hyperodae TaxID=165561 RepID=A0AA39G7J7_MICHY|nr:hypothetical protein PV327_001125 [Microctonus hyperodae]
MSTLIDWPPSSNISTTNSFTSSSSSSSLSSLLSTATSSLPSSTSSLSSLSSTLFESTDITSPLVITDVDDEDDNNIVARNDRLTTAIGCNNDANSCNHRHISETITTVKEFKENEEENYNNDDDTLNKSRKVKIEKIDKNKIERIEDEDEGYASGDESIEFVQHTDQVDVTGLLFGSEDDLITMEDNINNISFINDTYENENITNSNGTYVVIGEGMYPSGYSLIQIILASIAATILMITVVVGNMLVIIAIATEKALKNIQNWFIASLAVADFFLGLVVMPFSLANEIMGYWIFGYWWCDIYSAMDVLLCTASIMNLCLISLDRFWSITQAVEYLKKRTPARAALMIALVWILSALICIPPLLGWKRPAVKEEFPMCRLGCFVAFRRSERMSRLNAQEPDSVSHTNSK